MNDKERGHEIIATNKLNEYKSTMTKSVLLTFYETFGEFEEAQNLFFSIDSNKRDGFMHNKMMKVYLNQDCNEKVLSVFDSMSDALKDDVSYLLAIKACTRLKAFEEGIQIYDKIRGKEIGIQLKTALIDFFNQYEHVTNAEKIFDSIPKNERDCRVFNAMLGAFVDNDFNEEGIEFYEENSDLVDSHSFMLLITACIQMNNYLKGKEIHSLLMREDLNKMMDRHLRNRLIDFYGNFNDIEAALKLFESDKTSNNEYSLSSMMRAFIDNGECAQALTLYEDNSTLHDDVTHYYAIKACRNSKDLERGKSIHLTLRENDNTNIELFNILIGLYADCRDVDGAINVFDKIPFYKRNVATIHCLMECYYHCSMDKEAIDLYKCLQSDYPKLTPDVLIHITLLKSLTNLSMLSFGQEIEEKLIKNKMANHAEIKMNLINFYGKCGMLSKCEGIFNRDHLHHIGIWNAMLRAYGRNGDMINANKLFEAMKQQNGPSPDCKTYAILMNACNHCGDADSAQNLLSDAMREEEIVKYKDDKFVVCAFVDCMARKGSLDEAYSYLVEHAIQFEEAWRSLIAGCRKHNNMHLAETAMSKMKHLQLT